VRWLVRVPQGLGRISFERDPVTGTCKAPLSVCRNHLLLGQAPLRPPRLVLAAYGRGHLPTSRSAANGSGVPVTCGIVRRTSEGRARDEVSVA